MVLNGTLQESILADILQLLAQQKATGKLLLETGRWKGCIVIQEGRVIAAEAEGESLQLKLTNCLLSVKRIPHTIVSALPVAAGADIARCSSELIATQYLSPSELVAFSQAVIEDFISSLLGWREGEYHFESLTKVDQYSVQGVSLSVDYVIMEAMRRIDESRQIRSVMSDDTVFVQANRHTYTYSSDVVTLLAQPEQYALQFIDGLSTIAIVAQRTCIARFRLYEVLFRLWQSEYITPLSSRLSRSIKKALSRNQEGRGDSRSAAVAIALTASTVAAMVVFGLFSRGRMTHPSTTSIGGRELDVAISAEHAQAKCRTAILEYRFWRGEHPSSLNQVVQGGFIDREDMAVVPMAHLQY